MKAVRFLEPQKLDFIDIPEPVIGQEDVLVDVRYAGLCGTDLNVFRGRFPLVTYPRIPGHEISGTIIAKGELVPDQVSEGSLVMLSPYLECGFCPACRVGRINCCEFNRTLGVQRDGAMTERFAIHYSKVYTSDVLSLQELALVEPLSVGYHAANRGRVTEIDTVMIVGCGAVGMGAVCAAVRKGAVVIAVDVDDTKLALARLFGAQHTINSTTHNVLSEIKTLTHGEGVSVVIEAVGLPETFRLSIDAVAFAGRVVYIGYAKGEVSYNTQDFVRKELDIMGSRNALRVFPTVIQMLEQRLYPFTDLISRVYGFGETGEAFRAWDAQTSAFTKILIDMREGTQSDVRTK